MAERQGDRVVDDGVKQPLRRTLLGNSLKIVTLSPLVAACNIHPKPDPLPDGAYLGDLTSVHIADTRITFRTNPDPNFVIRYSPAGIRALSQIVPTNTEVTIYLHQANALDTLDLEPMIPSLRVPQPHKQTSCDSRFSLAYGPQLLKASIEVTRDQNQEDVIRSWNQAMRRMMYYTTTQSLHHAKYDLCDESTRPPSQFQPGKRLRRGHTHFGLT